MACPDLVVTPVCWTRIFSSIAVLRLSLQITVRTGSLPKGKRSQALELDLGPLNSLGNKLMMFGNTYKQNILFNLDQHWTLFIYLLLSFHLILIVSQEYELLLGPVFLTRRLRYQEVSNALQATHLGSMYWRQGLNPCCLWLLNWWSHPS